MALFEFKSHKAEVDQKVDQAIEQMLEAWGMTAQGFASSNCPVDTGNLSQSIDYGHDEDTMYVGTNVEYAAPVEFNDKAHHEVGKAHYLRDSIATHLDVYREIAQTYLKDNVEF